MISEPASVLARHDPAAWVRTLRYRARRELPYDAAAVGPDSSLLLDAPVYLDQLKGQLPADIIALIASRVIFHGAPVLAELTITLGILNPRDQRTRTRSSRLSTPSDESSPTNHRSYR